MEGETTEGGSPTELVLGVAPAKAGYHPEKGIEPYRPIPL